MGERKGRRIFARMIMTFLLVMLPIYALGLYIYTWGERTVKDEIFKSSKAQGAFYLKRLEEEIERIKILQYDCLNDESLQKLALRSGILDDYEVVDCVRQLHQRLGTIKSSSPYIRDVSARISATGRTISANAAVDDFDAAAFEGIRVPPGETGAQIVSFGDGLFLTTLHRSSFSSRNPAYSIVIDLDVDAFEEALAQFDTYPGSGAFLIGQANGMLLPRRRGAGAFTLDDVLASYRRTESAGIGHSVVGGTDYFVIQVESRYLDMVLLRYIPQRLVLTPMDDFYLWAWVYSIASVLIIAAYSLFSYRLIQVPLRDLVKAFRRVEQGDLELSIEAPSKDEFGYLYAGFNAMVRNLSTLIDQIYKQKILMQRAELKQLQAQINPHFLYNSFFMINTMAQIGDENLAPFTKYLGEYFRFITRNTADSVPLREEVQHARTYGEIQLMRFSKRLRIDFEECPERFADLVVPRLIVQPVVENAFQHAVERKKDAGVVSVTFGTEGDACLVRVEDNGCELTDEGIEGLALKLGDGGEASEVTGLVNIHRRIRLVYGDRCGLSVGRSGLGGLRVTLRLDPAVRTRYVPIVDR